jgi:hypothetical protein
VPILQVIPIAKKLRIDQAKFKAVIKKLIRFAHSRGVKKQMIAIAHKLICNNPGRPNKLLSTVLFSPVKYLSGVSI